MTEDMSRYEEMERPKGSPLVQMKVNSQQVNKDYMESLPSSHSVSAENIIYRITRIKPETYRGVKVNGMLEESSTPVMANEIQERFGGGDFKVETIDISTGHQKIRSSKIVQIAGEPNTKALKSFEEEGHTNDHADMLMKVLQEQTRKEEIRREAEVEQIKHSAQSEQKTIQLMMAMTQKSGDDYKMQVASEMRSLRESYENRIATMQDKITSMSSEHRRELEEQRTRLLDATERDKAAIRDAARVQIDSVKDFTNLTKIMTENSFTPKIAVMESELTRLRDENNRLRDKVEKLEEESVKDPIKLLEAADKIIVAIRGFDGDDEKEEGGLLEKLMGSGLPEKLLSRFSEATAAPAPVANPAPRHRMIQAPHRPPGQPQGQGQQQPQPPATNSANPSQPRAEMTDADADFAALKEVNELFDTAVSSGMTAEQIALVAKSSPRINELKTLRFDRILQFAAKFHKQGQLCQNIAARKLAKQVWDLIKE